MWACGFCLGFFLNDDVLLVSSLTDIQLPLGQLQCEAAGMNINAPQSETLVSSVRRGCLAHSGSQRLLLTRLEEFS